ncbi:MAG: glycine zipper 2TM domain-containing protein [Rhodospirillales bacterium]|nr:glycine zipper 2TM domain-containing protein [Rhodospirillales bacterium]
MLVKRFASAALAVLLLSACTEGQEKQQLGTIIGSGLGALVGSQIGSGKGKLVAVAIGAVAGGWAGNQLGKQLDEKDKALAEQTAQTSLEHNQTDQTSTWRNPDSGHSGSYTPTKTYKSADGEDCREFETTVTVDGKIEKAMGRACRQQDGSWQIVS